jgi:hypothetical protein
VAGTLRHLAATTIVVALGFAAPLVLPPVAEASQASVSAALRPCDYHPVAVTTGATACLDADPNRVTIADTLADGHHARAYWSYGSLTGHCDAFDGAGTSRTCRIPLGGHPTICFRAANMEGDQVVQDHLGSREISSRTCYSVS